MNVDGTITTTTITGRHVAGSFIRMHTYGCREILVEIIEDKGYSITYRVIPWYERAWMWVKARFNARS